VPLHDIAEVPEPPVMLVGVSVQRTPEVGDVLADRVTVPVNPLTADTVTVELAWAPALALTLFGAAAIVKL